MAFTEFTVRSGGSNMNGGRLNSNGEAATTPVYSATNGGWNSGTGVFTPTSGDPSATVTVGDFAHVFTDGSTTPTRIARVTAVNSTTVTLSTTAGSGTAPSTAGTGISINVGGAWAGPSGSVGFPWNFITSAATNAAGDRSRTNFKNDTTYSITATISHTLQGAMWAQGYTSSFGDGGRATIDGGTSGASYALWSQSGAGIADNVFVDMIFQNNGATGTASGVNAGSRNVFYRCVFHDLRGSGILDARCIECEAYNCNQSNNSLEAGFKGNGSATFCFNCVAHDNSGSNTSGFYDQSGSSIFISCIADTNGAHGFNANNVNSAPVFINCDAYNNGGSGIRVQGGNTNCPAIKNCNLVSNAAYGIDLSGGNRSGYVYNCGYHNNTSGTTNGFGSTMVEVGAVTLGAVPWVDAPNGDFRINLTAAKGAGRGAFTQTAASYAGAVGYPDIGAAQHQEIGGGGQRVFGG